MTPEIREYFKLRCEDCPVRVTPGHWPNFQSREEVDRYVLRLETMEQELLEVAE